MRSRSLGAAVTLIALTMVLAIAGPATAATASQASLSSNVKQWLTKAGPSDRLDSIVSFKSGAGVTKLKSLVGSVETLQSVPMAFTSLSAAQVREVASWSETRSVWDNRKYTLTLDESTRMIKADKVWAGEGLRRPYTGAGVGVAVVDSGIDATHPDLPYGAKVKKSFYIAGDPVFGNEPAVYIEGSPLTDTEIGHGTHVASTIAGTGAASAGRYKGVAPGADIYAFRAGAGLNIFSWWAVRAFDWVITNGPALNIRVISNSWGGGDGENYDPSDPVNIMSKAAYDKNIVIVFAAGNSGGPNMLGANSVSPYVICVGATDKSFKKASFSSTGRPGGDMTRDANGLYRPTISAPGVDIVAARSAAGVYMTTEVDTENPYYTHSDGTSMATPHVSGVVALMLEARPQLTAQNVIDIIEGTAMNMPDYEQWQVGAGFVDAQAAVRAAEKGQTTFRPSTNGKTPMYKLLSSKDWTGQVLPAGYAVVGQTTALASDTKVTVGSGVDALYAEIEWASKNESVYLQLFNPAGQLVEESAGLTDIGFVNFRTVVTTKPVAGVWTVRAIGRVNALTDYRGFWGQYALTKPPRTSTTTLVTSTTSFSGTVNVSVDPAVNDKQFVTFSVPAGATQIAAHVEWSDANGSDMDMYLYNPSGTQVASSTNDSSQPYEDLSVAGGGTDPMGTSTGLPAGTWKLEIRGWLVTAPEPFTGTYSVTAPAP